MNFSQKIVLILGILCVWCSPICRATAEESANGFITQSDGDTTKTQTRKEELKIGDVTEISEVMVKAKRKDNTIRSTAPLQMKESGELVRLGVLQVSDAVKHFSGVTVKDYGGIGGLKTVSVRSLGASHTAVSYDGMAMSDVQNGQIDIGRLSLDNVEEVSLANGQGDRIFQPARLFASAAVLNVETRIPQFSKEKVINGKVAMKGGSFGLVNPSMKLDSRLGERMALTVSGEWMSANGRYPYTLHYGDAATDSTSREMRENTDVRNWRGEATLYGHDSVQAGYVKVYYYHSERGLPGATIFYNTKNFSSQRLRDDNIFAQGRWERHFGSEWALMVNGKYNYAYTYYLDPVYLGSAGKEESRYRQQEGYVNVAARWRPMVGMEWVVTQDAAYSRLDANMADFAIPERWLSQTVVAGKWVNEWVTATASCLLTGVSERVTHGEAAKNRLKASPYVSASFKPFGQANLRIRTFYKNIFRLPTFNDLYYSRVGNRGLRPETTDQLNLGVTYQTAIARWMPMAMVAVDAYHNNVRDKIVAYPTKNIYTWTMLNYGRVTVDGIDLSCEIELKPWEKMSVIAGGTHTYNRALNRTSKGAKDYGHQIPYTPRVSGSWHASIETPWVTVGWSMVWSGHRYAVNQNYTENRVEGYADHSLTASHEFHIKEHHIRVMLECLNISNANYEVVRYFPMPGRSWRATVEWKF